jgi:hypothetical protein
MDMSRKLAVVSNAVPAVLSKWHVRWWVAGGSVLSAALVSQGPRSVCAKRGRAAGRMCVVCVYTRWIHSAPHAHRSACRPLLLPFRCHPCFNLCRILKTRG